jgi:methyl-accepting chemotaxis protein
MKSYFYSLKVKLILAVVFVSIIVFSAITTSIIFQQKQILEQEFQKQANVLAQALNSSIGSEESLSNQNCLQNGIYKLIWLNPDVVEININTFRGNELIVSASNYTTSIGEKPNKNNFQVIETGRTVTKKTKIGNNQVFLITSPIYLAGKTVGTYEIALSLIELDKEMRTTYFQLLLIMGGGIIALVLMMILLLNYVIINPITSLNKAVKSFSVENLSYRIKEKGNDEIGELSHTFNQMAKNLEKNYTQLQKLNNELQNSYQKAEKKVQERTKELEEAKTSLEKKVQQRTKELQSLKDNLEKQVKERTAELSENIEELEKIQELTTGRELKMIELKEKLKKMKQRLGEKE